MTISKLLRPVYVAKIKKLARGELQNPSQKLDNLGNPHGTRLVNHDQYRACGPGGHAAAQAQSGLPPRDSEAGLQATTASCSASTGGSGSNAVSAGSQSSFLDPSSRARAVPQRNTSQGAPAPFPIAPQSAAATSISAPSLAINLEPQHQRLQDLLLQEYQQQLQLLSSTSEQLAPNVDTGRALHRQSEQATAPLHPAFRDTLSTTMSAFERVNPHLSSSAHAGDGKLARAALEEMEINEKRVRLQLARAALEEMEINEKRVRLQLARAALEEMEINEKRVRLLQELVLLDDEQARVRQERLRAAEAVHGSALAELTGDHLAAFERTGLTLGFKSSVRSWR